VDWPAMRGLSLLIRECGKVPDKSFGSIWLQFPALPTENLNTSATFELCVGKDTWYELLQNIKPIDGHGAD
jgi:hypothetical protein